MATVGAITLTVGGALTIAGTLRPWVASGRRNRNSYDIVQLVDRLGFAPDGPVEVALRTWPLVPLLVVAATIAVWWRRHVLATVSGLAAGLYAGGVGVAVSTGPRDGIVRVVDGPRTTAAGAAIVLAGVVIIAVAATWRSVRDGQAERARTR